MKNKEIEGILNERKIDTYVIISKEEAKTILSYIEQLEKENEKLNKQVTEYQDEIFARDNNWYDMQD